MSAMKLWHLVSQDCIDLIGKKIDNAEAIAVEGPNGVGKTTLVRAISSYFGVPFAKGPRVVEGSVEDTTQGEKMQSVSELWLAQVCPKGRRSVILDRGWSSVYLYRKMFNRKVASDDYAKLFTNGVPEFGLVIFVDASDEDIEKGLAGDRESAESDATRVKERDEWRTYSASYPGSKIRLRRIGTRYAMDWDQ